MSLESSSCSKFALTSNTILIQNSAMESGLRLFNLVRMSMRIPRSSIRMNNLIAMEHFSRETKEGI
eukprot:1813091-Heterocapsa_arctica.AAC.1